MGLHGLHGEEEVVCPGLLVLQVRRDLLVRACLPMSPIPLCTCQYRLWA